VNSYVAGKRKPSIELSFQSRLNSAGGTAAPLASRYPVFVRRGVPGTEPLKQSDLESDDPFNTRNRLGLPPTPIANPGLASMRAAATPARVDYLYFVRKGESNRHFFTASEAEFCQKSLEYGFGGC